MSALGQKQTSAHARVMSAIPPKADIGTQPQNVRFVPKADIRLLINAVVCAQVDVAANALPSVPFAVSR
jgi:hypothetical protein